MNGTQVLDEVASRHASGNISSDSDTFVADKIIHALKIYPVISPTMLQAALGPGLSPKLWRPILSALLDNGTVIQKELTTTGPSGRQNTYTQLMLSPEKLSELQPQASVG
jgi:hypothetical protein